LDRAITNLQLPSYTITIRLFGTMLVRTLKRAIFYVSDDLGPTCRRLYYRIEQNAPATILPPYSLTYGPICHPLPPSFLLFSSTTILHHHRRCGTGMRANPNPAVGRDNRRRCPPHPHAVILLLQPLVPHHGRRRGVLHQASPEDVAHARARQERPRSPPRPTTPSSPT
jgi:hypothetical protein